LQTARPWKIIRSEEVLSTLRLGQQHFTSAPVRLRRGCRSALLRPSRLPSAAAHGVDSDAALNPKAWAQHTFAVFPANTRELQPGVPCAAGNRPAVVLDQQPAMAATMFLALLRKEACGMHVLAQPLRRWAAAAPPHRRMRSNKGRGDPV